VINIPIELLRTLVAVADLKNFTRAAQSLGLTQPAVSAQIKRLQNLLATELFDKSSAGVVLTREGKAVLTYARRLLSINDQILQVAVQEPSSRTLRVGVSGDYISTFLPRAFARLGRHSVYRRFHVTGTMNNAGTVIMEVADLSQMMMDARIDETSIASVKVGQHAKVRVQAFPDEVFDGVVESYGDAAVVGVETRDIVQLQDAAPLAITAMFRALQRDRLTGDAPKLVIVDEAWSLLAHPLFAAEIQSWAREMRKLKAVLALATQSLHELQEGPAKVIADQIGNRVYLPHAEAMRPQTRVLYEAAGLAFEDRGRLLDHTLAARVSHRPDKFRVLIQLEDCAAKGMDVVWWDQQAVETVHNHVTRFSGGDLRKAGSGSFVGYFGAPFEFRGENENAAFPVQFFDFFVESEQLYRCR